MLNFVSRNFPIPRRYDRSMNLSRIAKCCKLAEFLPRVNSRRYSIVQVQRASSKSDTRFDISRVRIPSEEQREAIFRLCAVSPLRVRGRDRSGAGRHYVAIVRHGNWVTIRREEWSFCAPVSTPGWDSWMHVSLTRYKTLVPQLCNRGRNFIGRSRPFLTRAVSRDWQHSLFLSLDQKLTA